MSVSNNELIAAIKKKSIYEVAKQYHMTPQNINERIGSVTQYRPRLITAMPQVRVILTCKECRREIWARPSKYQEFCNKQCKGWYQAKKQRNLKTIFDKE